MVMHAMPFSRAVLALFTLMSALVPTQASAQARHPLDALTADEIIRTVAIIRASGRLGAEARFATIDLAEPPKQQDTTPFSEDMRTYRTIVAPGVTGPIHQHFFSYRLDFDVDGTSNTVVEAQIESDPVGPANPEGHWFAARERVLATESKARRNVSTPTARTWRVVNEGHSNALGRPTAYASCRAAMWRRRRRRWRRPGER